MTPSRYVIGIDLGTTNSAVAYVDTALAAEKQAITVFPVPQLVHPGEIQDISVLPSFGYLPGPKELPKGSLCLPWDERRNYAVGLLARTLGEKIPQRLVESAKSWLCHNQIDRTAPLLPWGSDEEVGKISALEAVERYLRHLKEAWNHVIADGDAGCTLQNQEVFLTVPASFDTVARDLTAQAARQAGIERLVLIEEPQAAFYAWLHTMGEEWRDSVSVGDTVLVCDVGGGTTDFALITVFDEAGDLVLERLAVGEHILLGGDNMDLALAHLVKAKLAEAGHHLDLRQTLDLRHACRVAKERFFSEPDITSLPITLVGSGSRLIGGTVQTDLTREEAEGIVLEGFFSPCRAEERPVQKRRSALQELGLPYAADAAIPKHIAKFLGENGSKTNEPFLRPTAMLFNGGVFKTERFQERIARTLESWLSAAGGEVPLRILQGADHDLAVARGAAKYGLSRRGQGIRIRAGTARSYYIGIETSMPAIPGMEPPIKALCVAPFGMEEGTEIVVPAEELGLVVGEPVAFRFLSSRNRGEDKAGQIIEEWKRAGIEETSPVEAELAAQAGSGGEALVPVELRARATELGTLELWCVARSGEGEWKMEFNVRE